MAKGEHSYRHEGWGLEDPTVTFGKAWGSLGKETGKTDQRTFFPGQAVLWGRRVEGGKKKVGAVQNRRRVLGELEESWMQLLRASPALQVKAQDLWEKFLGTGNS